MVCRDCDCELSLSTVDETVCVAPHRPFIFYPMSLGGAAPMHPVAP
jgi:hypothetical protein